MMFAVDLLRKIIYQCNELLFERLLFWISVEHLHLLILRAFILPRFRMLKLFEGIF